MTFNQGISKTTGFNSSVNKTAVLNNIFKNSSVVNVAKGTLTGSTAEIYKTVQALIDSEAESTLKTIIPIENELNPANNYLGISWSDWMQPTDLYNLALANKYRFTNTFQRQIISKTNDYLNTTYDRDKLKMIEQSGSWDAGHGLFDHIAYITAAPLFDGRTTPTNDELRIARADGTNEMGNDVTSTVDDCIGAGLRAWWLLLSDELGAKAWEDLSDADCIALRKSLGVFGMPLDGQNYQKVLEALDYLSERYCGTSGYSVLDGDYITRTPNTIGGVEPDDDNRIQGGIFQGASSTFNHEIWERALSIENAYKIEFEGKTKSSYHMGTCGGMSRYLLYVPEGPRDGTYYTDKDHTKVASGASEYLSSITSLSRSYIDMLIDNGYNCSMFTQGDGFAYWDGCTRNESQRTVKKNGLKKPDNVGDGFINDLRQWDISIPLVNQENLLLQSDIVNALYDETFTNADGRYTGYDEYSGNRTPFNLLVNAITRFNAWGITPVCIADSYCTGDQVSSYMLMLEALYQFCFRAGITVISREEATIMGITKSLPTGYNYFPNNTFATTPKTITASINAPNYPDGWGGGVVLSEDTGDGAVNVLHIDSNGIIFTRQYAITPSTLNLSFRAKGVGTLKIRKILNKDAFNSTSGALFTEINSITINSPAGYTEYTDTVIIPDAAMEVYGDPATPTEAAYQNYMKGYGDKICGIQIELVITGGNYVKMGNCNLIEI